MFVGPRFYPSLASACRRVRCPYASIWSLTRGVSARTATLMNIRRNFSNIALWCHLALAVIAAFVVVVLALSLIGVSPEGLGMGLFLLIYSLIVPGLLLAFVAIAFTLISPSKNLLPATLLLLLVGVIAEYGENPNLSLVLIMIYIATVAWAWKTKEHSSSEAEQSRNTSM